MARKDKEKKNINQNTDMSKWEKVSLAMAECKQKYGEGHLMRLGDAPEKKYDTISSGSIALDIVLGNNGYPKGRVIEVYGPESVGKSTVTLHLIAEAQKKGNICALVDAEHALDVKYAKDLGVNTEDLLVSQPFCGEDALETVEILVRSGGVDVIVVDSVASLVPRAEVEGEMGDSHIGLQARLMSQALRKLTAIIAKSNTLVFFTNQIREKVGVMFGNPETTSGGRALRFYASIRLDMRRVEQIKQGTEFVGSRVKVTAVKNKCAPPFSKAEFDIEYGTGISKVGEILDFGIELGIVDKNGSWFSYDGSRLGQGREAVKTILRDNPELADEIEFKIRKELGMLDE